MLAHQAGVSRPSQSHGPLPRHLRSPDRSAGRHRLPRDAGPCQPCPSPPAAATRPSCETSPGQETPSGTLAAEGGKTQRLRQLQAPPPLHSTDQSVADIGAVPTKSC